MYKTLDERIQKYLREPQNREKKKILVLTGCARYLSWCKLELLHLFQSSY